VGNHGATTLKYTEFNFSWDSAADHAGERVQRFSDFLSVDAGDEGTMPTEAGEGKGGSKEEQGVDIGE